VYIARDRGERDFGQNKVAVVDLYGKEWGTGREGTESPWDLWCGIPKRRGRSRASRKHKGEEEIELYHGKRDELGEDEVGSGELEFKVGNRSHQRLDVTGRGLDVLRKIWDLVVVDTNGEGSPKDGEVGPRVAKVLSLRLKGVLTTLVGYGPVRSRFRGFLAAVKALELTHFWPLGTHEGRKKDAFREKSCWPGNRKGGFAEDLTQFRMEAIVVNMSVVVGLLAPVLFDAHTRHKHIEGREEEMLSYFIVQAGVGGVRKICFERSMHLFRERGVEIVVVEVGSGIDSVCTNMEEAGVVLATRTTKGVEFPESGRHEERGITAHEDGVVPITLNLDLHVWGCIADSQGRGRPWCASGKKVRVQVCVACEILTGGGAGVPA